MAKGYLIANIEVRDATLYEQYRRDVPAVVAKFGGRFVVRGGTLDRLEHAEGFHRIAILEFPTVEAARHFYASPDYKPLLALRERASHSQVMIVEGTPA